MSEEPEVILAQEQGAFMRQAGRAKEVEAEFGFDEIEGTLVLTNTRLIFVCTSEKEDDLRGQVGLNPAGKVRVIYSEVEEIGDVPAGPPNAFVEIASITMVKGHSHGLGRPSLEIEWKDGQETRGLVFSEGLTRRGGKHLGDWAAAIEKLRAGNVTLVHLPRAPSVDVLEGKIARVLADMQEKGVFAIEEAVETEFGVQLDPDDVQAACDRLSSSGLLKRRPDPSGDVFYRRASPLGEDDLSS